MINRSADLPKFMLQAKRSMQEPKEISNECLIISRVLMVIVVEVQAMNIIEMLVAWSFQVKPEEIHKAGPSPIDLGRNDAADNSKNSNKRD